MGIARVRPLEDGGQRLGHAVRPERRAPGRGLAEGQQVRLQPPAPREPARSTDLRVRLVDHQQRVVVAGNLAQRGVEPRRGLDHPDVGHCRLGHDAGDISWGQGCRERLGIIERDDADPAGGTGVKPQQLGDETATARSEQHLIGMTVVTTVEHDHDRPARGDPRQAHGFDIGGGGGEGELPAGRPYRRRSSSATQIASSVGKRNCPPCAMRSATAATTGAGSKPQKRLMSARLNRGSGDRRHR